MLKSPGYPNNDKKGNKGPSNSPKENSVQLNKLATIGKMSATIADSLYKPIDATNRFINLALQSTEESSQSRQFLLESKSGLRKMSVLLKRLNGYTRRMEQEINEIFRNNK